MWIVGGSSPSATTLGSSSRVYRSRISTAVRTPRSGLGSRRLSPHGISSSKTSTRKPGRCTRASAAQQMGEHMVDQPYLELRRKLTERDRSLHEKVVSLDEAA